MLKGCCMLVTGPSCLIYPFGRLKFPCYIYVDLSGQESITPNSLYILICYVSTTYSTYAMTLDGDSPYLYFFPEISRFSSLGDILLMGGFQTCTCTVQCYTYDISLDSLHLKELDRGSLGLSCCSFDAGTIITLYGRHLINLGESHDIIVLNRNMQFPHSNDLFSTCWRSVLAFQMEGNPLQPSNQLLGTRILPSSLLSGVRPCFEAFFTREFKMIMMN